MRWTLREFGVTLAGPPPATLIDQVPAAALRDRMRRTIPSLLSDLATWIDIGPVAWGQRYAVVTLARMLYTADTGRVCSKPQALAWARATLDPRWRPLLQQAGEDRALGFDPHHPPREGSVAETRAFAAYAVERVTPHLGQR